MDKDIDIKVITTHAGMDILENASMELPRLRGGNKSDRSIGAYGLAYLRPGLTLPVY